MKKSFRKNIISSLIFLLLIIIIFNIANYYFRTKDPISALKFNLSSYNGPFKLKTILNTVDIDSNSKFIFYQNQNNAISHAFLLKKWNRSWKVISIRGQIPMTSSNRDTSFFKHSLNYSKNKTSYIYGGIVYDKNINSIHFAGKQARIIQNKKDIRIWYLKTDENLSNYEIEIYN